MKATFGPEMNDEYSTMMRDAIRRRRSTREGASPYTSQFNTQNYTNAMADANGVARGTSGGAVGTAPGTTAPALGAAALGTSAVRPRRIGSTFGSIY